VRALRTAASIFILLRMISGSDRSLQIHPKKSRALLLEMQIRKLLSDPEIIRNRMKIESCRTQRPQFLKVQEEFGKYDSYCWRFVDGRPKLNRWKTAKQIPARSPESERLSKDLKQKGFNFVGPTVTYAYMQAIGMVNDHTVDCFRYREIAREFADAN